MESLRVSTDELIGYRNRGGKLAVQYSDEDELVLPSGRTLPVTAAWTEDDEDVDPAEMTAEQIRIINGKGAAEDARIKAQRDLAAKEKARKEKEAEDAAILTAMWHLHDNRNPSLTATRYPDACALIKEDPQYAEDLWRADHEERQFRRDLRALERLGRLLMRG